MSNTIPGWLNISEARNLQAMEKFSLKWNDFHSNISKSFQSLRNKEDFSDVTLVGDDFKQVAAHKIILSSCSTYFNNILKNIANQKHPILCLEGMSFQDIEKVMDYIYNGELRIYQDDIDKFLDLGQRLGLEGLVGITESPRESTLEENDTVKLLDESYDVEVQSYEKKRINKTSIKDKGVLMNATFNQAIVSFAQGSSIDTIEELDKKVGESYLRDNVGGYLCLYCHKVFKNTGHAREHVEVHFDGLSLNCNYCEKTFRSRYGLRKHVKNMHKDANH